MATAAGALLLAGGDFRVGQIAAAELSFAGSILAGSIALYFDWTRWFGATVLVTYVVVFLLVVLVGTAAIA
jgi:hypothetical protein